VTTTAATGTGPVRLERSGAVAVLTLQRPEQRNALDDELAHGVLAALAEVRDDEAIACVVIAAEGSSFCSGGNLDLLERVGADPTAPDGFAALGAIYRVFETLADFPVPTIAAAQGGVIGAGVNLLLAADLALVADDVVIRGFGRAGVHPGGGHLSLLLRKAPAAAAAIALFDRDLGADDAVRTGLAWRAVPRDRLQDEALAIAAAAANDRELVRSVTATFRAADATRPRAAAAVLLERAPQMWSLRRAQLRRSGDPR
jgi:enoyl-CoA hydratase